MLDLAKYSGNMFVQNKEGKISKLEPMELFELNEPKIKVIQARKIYVNSENIQTDVKVPKFTVFVTFDVCGQDLNLNFLFDTIEEAREFIKYVKGE